MKRFQLSLIGAGICLGLGYYSAVSAQPDTEPRRLLTVKQLMNAMLTPATNTVWGAYQLQTDAEWQAVENAALTVIATADLLSRGGAGEGEAAMATEADWQTYNRHMLGAAREVIAAVAARDEEALSAAGNDLLYPPCESCHQQYQNQ